MDGWSIDTSGFVDKVLTSAHLVGSAGWLPHLHAAVFCICIVLGHLAALELIIHPNGGKCARLRISELQEEEEEGGGGSSLHHVGTAAPHPACQHDGR